MTGRTWLCIVSTEADEATTPLFGVHFLGYSKNRQWPYVASYVAAGGRLS